MRKNVLLFKHPTMVINLLRYIYNKLLVITYIFIFIHNTLLRNIYADFKLLIIQQTYSNNSMHDKSALT